MDSMLSLACLLIVIVIVSASPEKDKLFQSLMQNYVKSIPTLKENTTLTMNLGLGMARAEIDEESYVMTSNVWLRALWKEYRLEWNPTEHGGVSIMHIPSDLLWIPDITMYHYSIDEPKLGHVPNAVVYSDGTVVFVPPLLVKVDCRQDYQAVYTCPMTFGAYTYDGFIMEFEYWLGQKKIDIDDYKVTKQGWQVIGNTANIEVKYYPCCPEPQPIITFEATFARKDRRNR